MQQMIQIHELEISQMQLIIIIQKICGTIMQITSSKVLSQVKLEEQDSSLRIPHSEKLSNQVQGTRSTTWSQRQLYLVASFFYYHSSKLTSESSRKRWKVFKTMSELLQSRNVNQCRSYTKKLFKTFKTVFNINSFFKSSLPRYKPAIQDLKSANSKLYGKRQSLKSEINNLIDSQLKYCNLKVKPSGLVSKKNLQNQPNQINRQVFQKSNVLLPQVERRPWFNSHLWLLNHHQFVSWLSNLHYLANIMEFQ